MARTTLDFLQVTTVCSEHDPDARDAVEKVRQCPWAGLHWGPCGVFGAACLALEPAAEEPAAGVDAPGGEDPTRTGGA